MPSSVLVLSLSGANLTGLKDPIGSPGWIALSQGVGEFVIFFHLETNKETISNTILQCKRIVFSLFDIIKNGTKEYRLSQNPWVRSGRKAEHGILATNWRSWEIRTQIPQLKQTDTFSAFQMHAVNKIFYWKGKKI